MLIGIVQYIFSTVTDSSTTSAIVVFKFFLRSCVFFETFLVSILFIKSLQLMHMSKILLFLSQKIPYCSSYIIQRHNILRER